MELSFKVVAKRRISSSLPAIKTQQELIVFSEKRKQNPNKQTSKKLVFAVTAIIKDNWITFHCVLVHGKTLQSIYFQGSKYITKPRMSGQSKAKYNTTP